MLNTPAIYAQAVKGSAKKTVLEHMLASVENWQYFKLTKAINAKIIEHSPCPGSDPSNLSQCASATIVQTTEGEIFRVLELQSEKKFLKDQLVKIKPAETPKVRVSHPFLFKHDPGSYKNLAPLSDSDKEVKMTTWGVIE